MSDAEAAGEREAGETVGAVIPYRMAASRLPGKPLRDVAGRTALERVVDRARAAACVTTVVVATTRETTDDPLATFAGELGLTVHRGSTEDVLARLAGAAEQAGLDVVVEIDGDDLLCASEYMDRGVAVLREERADMVSFRGLPTGATPNVLRTGALRRAVEAKSYADTQTGFFRFLRESGLFRIVEPEIADERHRHAAARMTLDYDEDLAFFSAVYAELDALGRPFDLADVVALLRRRPELVEINRGMDERYRAHFDAGLADMRLGSQEER